MIRFGRIVLSASALLGMVALPATAQQVASLSDNQRLGLQLFGQHCGVCHTKPTILSPLFGPALSKDTVDGKEAGVVAFIQSGTPRMPGFRYEFKPAEIEAIVDYLHTVPKPPPEAPAPTNRPNAQDMREAD